MKNRRIIFLVIIINILLLFTGISYAYYKTRIKSLGSKISVMGSNFGLNITDNGLTLSGVKPIYDKNKKTQAVKKEFTISIGSAGVISACYDLYIDVTSLGENLRNKYFKYELTNGTDTYTGSFEGKKDNSQILIIRNQNINTTNTSNSYTLYLWLSYIETEDQTSMLKGDEVSRTFKGRILAKAVTGTCKETDTDPTTYKVNLIVINGKSDKSQQDIVKGKDATFTITPNDGYTLENASISCSNGTLTNNIFMISDVQGDTTCTITLGKSSTLLTDAILRDNPTISERTSFSSTNITNTTGTIYKTNKTEDGSYVYYYSGNTINNWVYFGGFYWRIIRTNEDGSIRMLYSGTTPDTTSGYIGTSTFNDDYNKTMYAGYMYGTNDSLSNNRKNTNDSTIKKTVDSWYENNLLTNYDKYISESAIYCNDRSIGSGSYNSTTFYYGGYARLNSTKSPSYKCGVNASNNLFSTADNADKFSASTDGGGNGQLKYPIALMTADEVSFAGGVYNASLSSPYAWYYTNSAGASIVGTNFWWLLSPYSWENSYSRVFSIYGSDGTGTLNNDPVTYWYGIRPSISLNSCVQVSGIGTSSSPYVVDYDNSCN